jgi:hypothetical protein
MSPESQMNKIFLPKSEKMHPTRSIHNGRHVQQISKRLARQMDDILDFGKQNGWGKTEYRGALRKIIVKERRELRLGTRALNKHARPGAM